MNFSDGFGNDAIGYSRVNLDHVAELRPVKQNGKWAAYDCYSANGEKIGRIGCEEIPEHPITVVPDTTGTILIEFYLDDDDNVRTMPYPVVAWRIEHESADPVTCELRPDVWCLQLPTGIYSFPCLDTCETLEQAKKYALEQLQAKRKVRQA